MDPSVRVSTLLSRYSGLQPCATHWLCDIHDPEDIAFQLIMPDLTVIDISYQVLKKEAEQFAAALYSIGIRQGYRVATFMGKSREYLVTVLAIWRLGAVHVPLFTAFATPSVVSRLTASKTTLVVCDAANLSKLVPGSGMRPDWKMISTGRTDPNAFSFADLMTRSYPEIDEPLLDESSPIIQIYTSGTTGKPKGVSVPIRALASFQIYAEYGLGLTAEDVFWNAADPGWAYGLYYGILAPLLIGVKAIFLEGGFSAELTMDVLSHFGVTNFAAAPTVFRSLLSANVSASPNLKLRRLSSAGEPLTPDVNPWSTNVFGVPVHDHYGQTETGMLVNNHHHPEICRPLKPKSMGYAMPGWKPAILKVDQEKEAAIGEVGRIAMDLSASPLAWFDGYVNEPREVNDRLSSDKKWYVTGDMGYVDKDGYFFFASREDDVIIMAGYRIGPNEIENILLDHPSVKECAVVAAPDAIRGEVLEAVIVLRQDFRASEELTRELQKWVKSRYGSHAYPRRVHYVEALPKTPSGKLQRFNLRTALEREARGARLPS